jgi:hypothetical protein
MYALGLMDESKGRGRGQKSRRERCGMGPRAEEGSRHGEGNRSKDRTPAAPQ